MATNKQVRQRLEGVNRAQASGLVQRLLDRETASAATTSAGGAAATTGTATASAGDGESASADDLSGSPKAPSAMTADGESGSSDREDGELEEVVLGTDEEWAAFRESREERAQIHLDPFERMRSEQVVASLRTGEEHDVTMTVGESVITNHETGLEPVAVRDRTRDNSLRVMPPADEWPVGNSDGNLLAQARVNVEDYDHSFAAERERARNFGAPRVHPIPVVLYPRETQAEYEAAFRSHVESKLLADGSRRSVYADAAAQRSQRMQFAVERVREYRKRTGAVASYARAPMAAARRRATPDVSLSPPPAPQRQRQDPARPQGGVQQAPMSSASVGTRATARGTAFGHAPSLSATATQRGSAAGQFGQSAAPVAHANAAPVQVASSVAVGSLDALLTLYAQSQQMIGALQSRLDAQSDELAKLREDHESVESRVFALEESLAEEHARSKNFHARYAPRVKALWRHQSAVEDHCGLSESQRLGDWDDDPQ